MKTDKLAAGILKGIRAIADNGEWNVGKWDVYVAKDGIEARHENNKGEERVVKFVLTVASDVVKPATD